LAPVLEVLKGGMPTYRYVPPKVFANNKVIVSRIKPMLWPLLLSTEFTVEIEPLDEHCVVRASTKSQLFLLGDAFGFYDGYIRDFFDALESRLADKAA
jgi:hypothetical protein